MSARRPLYALLASAAASALIVSCLDSFDPAQTQFTLSPTRATVLIADTFRLTLRADATAPPGALRARWSSSNVAIATVDAAGLVRGVGLGRTLAVTKISKRVAMAT